MKKKLILLTIALSCLLCGCAATEAEQYPSYFVPIMQVLEEKWQGGGTWWSPVDTIREAVCVPDLENGGSQRDGIFECYIYEDDACYYFDLKDFFTGMEQEDWAWNSEGVMRREEGDTTCICWYDFDTNAERKPDLVLVEFDNDNPENFQASVHSFEENEEFGWYVYAYQLGDNVYVGGQENGRLGAINLKTREFTSFYDEAELLKDYAVQNISAEILNLYHFSVVYEEEEVRVYAAQIEEGNDAYPTAMVLMAVRGKDPIAYMTVDLISMDAESGIKWVPAS